MSAFSPECQETQTKSELGAFLPLEKKLKQFQKDKSRRLILIAGPTACGKSALALILAKLLKGEIVSADSMQVYRGMDIGTAKVSQEEREEIPHHLIDIRSIQQPFNVVDFYYEAKQACEAILARDRVPIVVGGSGFYFRALLYGPPGGPPSMPELRHTLEVEINRVGTQVFYEYLQQFDPEYAKTIMPGDRHKIIRAIEIIKTTGEKVSKLEWKRPHPLPDFAYHCWFLYRPRSVLYPAIEARCEQMLELGLIDEVKKLEKEGLRSNPSAAQAIGYRQGLDFLESSQDEKAYQEFVRKFKAASRHYAKRQFTWFRKEPLFEWLNVDTHDLEIAAEMIAQDYYRAVE